MEELVTPAIDDRRSGQDPLESFLETEEASPVLQRWSRLALEVAAIRVLHDLDNEIQKVNVDRA